MASDTWGGEHLTIQLGNYANYVGTHYWNYQDELYMRCTHSDIAPLYEGHDFQIQQLYRFGRTVDGHDTCTPRLLMIDKKENMLTFNPEVCA